MEPRLINVNDLDRYTVVIEGHRYVPWVSLAEVPTAQKIPNKLDRNVVVRAQPTIEQPPNDPLTLEELREMDGEPVWLSGDELNRYDIFRGERSPGWADFYCGRFSLFCYGKDWLAYRRRLEGDGQDG